MHCLARAFGVAARDGAQDRRVVANGSLAQAYACGSASVCVATARRADSRVLRRPVRAIRCRWPARARYGSRDRSPRASRNRRRAVSIRATHSRSAVRSARVAFLAASAAISPSISLRAASSSNGPGPASSPTSVPPRRPRAVRSVTKMPLPTRTSTSPAISREMIASRTDVRDTPSSVASSRSAGSRAPTANSPFSMSAAICPAICRYSRSGSTVCNGTQSPSPIGPRGAAPGGIAHPADRLRRL